MKDGVQHRRALLCVCITYRSSEGSERSDEGEGGDELGEGDEDGRPQEGRHDDPVRRNAILRADDTADLTRARALGNIQPRV